MVTFRLEYEGVTDQISIENILFGLFDEIEEDYILLSNTISAADDYLISASTACKSMLSPLNLGLL